MEPRNTVLLDAKVVEETMLYIWMNSVVAALGERVAEWDHFMIRPGDWGKPKRFKRPDFFRDKDPSKPEFTPMPPEAFSHVPLDELIAYIEKRIAEEFSDGGISDFYIRL